MILLLPFYILKLRHRVEKAKTGEELKLLANELKSQIDNLTLLTKESGYAGILEKKDIHTVQSLMGRLFKELYTGYTELEEVNTMLVTEIKTDREELEEKLAEQERQKLDSARKLKARGLPLEHIAEDIGLPLEVVEKL